MDNKELCFRLTLGESLRKIPDYASINTGELTHREEVLLLLFTEKPAKSLCFYALVLPFRPPHGHATRLA